MVARQVSTHGRLGVVVKWMVGSKKSELSVLQWISEYDKLICEDTFLPSWKLKKGHCNDSKVLSMIILNPGFLRTSHAIVS
jgi:hypothetical protein